MFSRYQTVKGSTTPISQSHMQSSLQPLATLQNPLLAKVNLGMNDSATTIHNPMLGHANLPPVPGANTKVHERVFGPAPNPILTQGPSPHPFLSEPSDQSNLIEPESLAEGGEGIHTHTLAQAAELTHVGDAPFATSSIASSSSDKVPGERGWLQKERH